jgi:hypothetical protein
MGKLKRGFVGCMTCAGLLALAACGRESQDEMSWTRGALERNKTLEIVAADQQSRTFTVRVKDTGELRTVRTDEVIGSPSAATSSAGAAEPVRVDERPAMSAAAPAEQSRAQASTPAAEEPAAPAETERAHSEPVRVAESSAGLEHDTPGRVLESGPGYTITSAQPAAPGAARLRDSASSAPLERRHEPIVCQGARLLHIDNRNLVFDGDAVSAVDGCEIHITNSHITAAGVGIAARAANVHIDNSQIEGEQASIDASQGAQVYATSSRFRGLSRRLDTATVHDLGGNIWN